MISSHMASSMLAWAELDIQCQIWEKNGYLVSLATAISDCQIPGYLKKFPSREILHPTTYQHSVPVKANSNSLIIQGIKV